MVREFTERRKTTQDKITLVPLQWTLLERLQKAYELTLEARDAMQGEQNEIIQDALQLTEKAISAFGPIEDGKIAPTRELDAIALECVSLLSVADKSMAQNHAISETLRGAVQKPILFLLQPGIPADDLKNAIGFVWRQSSANSKGNEK